MLHHDPAHAHRAEHDWADTWRHVDKRLIVLTAGPDPRRCCGIETARKVLRTPSVHEDQNRLLQIIEHHRQEGGDGAHVVQNGGPLLCIQHWTS
jgi:hypothetical protein